MQERKCAGTPGREESVRSRDHRAAFKAMRSAAIWKWKLHESASRLGTVLSNKVRMNRGLPHGALESPVIFTMIMELVLRDLITSWMTRKLAWSLDDFVLAAASGAAAEVRVTEVTAKLKEVGLSVGAQKTHWTSHPKMIDRSIVVDGLAVPWEEVLEFVGSKVCLGGNARYANCTQTSSSQQVSGEVSGEVEIRFEFFSGS